MLRKLARVTLNVLTALSLLLCVAACALWGLHRSRVEVYEWPAGEDRSLQVVSGDGLLLVGDARVERGRRFGEVPLALDAFRLRSAGGVRGGQGWLESTSPGVGTIAVRYRVVPYYQLVAATLAVPVVRLAAIAARALRRRYRSMPGHCPACGYDLRATPGRCPECGREPGKGEQ